MKKIEVEIIGKEIRLDHLLKIAGVAISGGQAGQMILDNMIKINGNIVYEKRKKIKINDEIIFDDEYLLILRESKNENK